MIGIIYNPLSRKGKNRHRVEDIRRILDGRGVEYIYRETESPGDGVRVSREVCETCDVVIAVGGDGTVHEVINGSLGSDAVIGVLPFGSGNDVARSLGVYGYSDEGLADMIVNPEVRTMDCGVCEGRGFTLFLAFGVVAGVVECYMGMKKPGKTAYSRAAIKAIRRHKPRRYTITLPDREFECFADYVTMQNTVTAGGGLKVCSRAVDDDGVMELVIVHRRGFFRLLANAVALFTGRLLKQPNVEVIPVTSCDIDPGEKVVGCIDGELVEMGRVHCEMGEPIRVLH